MIIKFRALDGAPAVQIFSGSVDNDDLLDAGVRFDSRVACVGVERFVASVSAGDTGTFMLSKEYARPPLIVTALNTGALVYGSRNYRDYTYYWNGSSWVYDMNAAKNTIYAISKTDRIDYGVRTYSGVLTILALIIPGVH